MLLFIRQIYFENKHSINIYTLSTLIFMMQHSRASRELAVFIVLVERFIWYDGDRGRMIMVMVYWIDDFIKIKMTWITEVVKCQIKLIYHYHNLLSHNGLISGNDIAWSYH